MATLPSVRQTLLSEGVCLILVSLLLPTFHVQLGLVPDHELTKMLSVRSEKVSGKVTKHLNAQWFRKASIERLEKCGLLCGKSVEARLQSRILWLLHLNQSQAQVAEALAGCSPRIGDEVVPMLKQTVHWFSDIGMAQDDFVKAMTTYSSVFVISASRTCCPQFSGCWIWGLERDKL